MPCLNFFILNRCDFKKKKIISVTEALSNTKKADARLISFSNAAAKRKNVFDKWNDTLATKLQNLKDKIAEARNTADGVITLSYFLNIVK